MSTLQRIRKFALVAVVATGALIASATQADEGRTSERPSIAGTIANLGQMTVLARRPAEIAHLGSMTVTAQRLSDTRVADLGAMTVTALRFSDTLVADLGAMTVTARRAADTRDTQVADLGGITVTARRIGTVTVAAQPSDRSWN